MKCEVLVDWLTFSVKSDDPNEVIREYLDMDPDLFQDAGHGLMSYQSCKRFSDIFVAYEGREDRYFKDMGVCVSMSGNGCRAFEKFSGLGGPGDVDQQGMVSVAFPVLFQKLVAEGVHVSRLDIACDEREGDLDMDTIIASVQANDINSRLRKRSVVYQYDGKQRSGATVYIGAPSSSFRLRIYDKAQEQGVEGHWIRVEMVLRDKHAGAFVGNMTQAESVGKLAAQVLNDKVAFIMRDDTNISRCSVCSWWSDFVSELDTVVLVARQTIQHTVERIDSWLVNQVAPSLWIIADTIGFRRLFDIAREAEERLNAKQEALIRDFQAVRRAGERGRPVPAAIPAAIG